MSPALTLVVATALWGVAALIALAAECSSIARLCALFALFLLLATARYAHRRSIA